MPINLPADLPAIASLEKENIFVISENAAIRQDIRPMDIAIVNLMPTKIATETQFVRLLSNTPLQVNVTLVRAENRISKHTSTEHLERFYTTFSQIKHRKFDGMIITGAPVEHLSFEEVDYWDELCQIMEYSNDNVFSTVYICWAAQAGLYHHYGIPKHNTDQKIFGIYPHTLDAPKNRLFRGFDDVFYMPHSRHSRIERADVEKVPELRIDAESDVTGIAIAENPNLRQIFITGHFEYDPMTLAEEYFRDKKRGLEPKVPVNYFKNDNPLLSPVVSWRGHAHLFFLNWLNYYLYQQTPFDLHSIPGSLRPLKSVDPPTG